MLIDAKFHLIGVEPILSGHGKRSSPEAGQRSRVHLVSLSGLPFGNFEQLAGATFP
jgi:hypothetical protein